MTLDGLGKSTPFPSRYCSYLPRRIEDLKDGTQRVWGTEVTKCRFALIIIAHLVGELCLCCRSAQYRSSSDELNT